MSANSRKWSLLVCAGVLLLICVPSAQAGTGTCSDTWANVCTATANNICANSPCTITISHNTQGSAVAQLNGSSQTYICVSAGQTVNWATDSGATFTATFSSSATPFNNSAAAFNNSSNSGTISTSAKGTCSQFSMTEMLSGHSYVGDPKVIVHP